MASASAGAPGTAVAAVTTAAAVLVVGLVVLVAERPAMLAVSPGRSAPAAGSASEGPRPGPGAERALPEWAPGPSSTECTESRLDRGDGISGLRVVAISAPGALGAPGVDRT